MLPLSLLLTVATLEPAHAAPALIPVQGELTDANDQPIDQALAVRFSLYADDRRAQTLWSETQTIDFDRGSFTAYLGSSTVLDLSLFQAHPQVWLGIRLGTAPELDPIPLGTVPYAAFAMSAGDAMTLEGASASAFRRSSTPIPWSDLRDVPAEIFVDTTYSAGTGLTLTGTSFSANAGFIQDEARKVCYHSREQITEIIDGDYIASVYAPLWSEILDVPTDLARTDDVVLRENLAEELEALDGFDLPAGTTIGGRGIADASLSNPLIQFGSVPAVPITTHYGGRIDFPRHFAKPPAWKVAIDESINNNGAVWCHGRRQGINRAWFRCDTAADGLSWMAAETGRHTIDGKVMEAGIAASVRNKDTIFFGETFPTAPAVILMGGWASVHERVIGTDGATTGGFQVGGVHTASQPLHWIALEKGVYNYNGYRFEVGEAKDPRNNGRYDFDTEFESLPDIYYTIWDTDDFGAVYVRTIDVTTTDFQIYMNDNRSEFLYYVAVERVQ